MKRIIQLIIAFVCVTVGMEPMRAANSYWDGNGPTAGAGNAPTGIWDSDSYWSSDANGAVSTAGWADGNTAIFSAGTDAVNSFNVTVSGSVNVGGITFEEGLATITGGTITITNVADFPIVAKTNAAIVSFLSGAGFKKTGPGTLTLGADNFTGGLGGANTIAEGIVAITNATALGSTLNPTAISNGASVELTTAISFANPVILNGFGVSNRGALYGYVGGTGTANSRNGGAVINSDARINHYGTNGTRWNWTTTVITTNGLNTADVYFGGNGHVLRLDINAYYPDNPSYRRPPIDVGDGVIHKDGSMELRFENANVAREVRFNEGHILARCGPGTNFCYRAVVPGLFWCTEGAFWSGDYVPATIYVGPNAGEFRNGTGGPSQDWEHPIVLAAGANPVFRPQSFADAHITCNGPISGLGGLSKYNDAGALNLNTNNTYSGNTTILGGSLALGANGSISNSAAIDVQTGAAFDVSAVTGGFVLQPGQTLKGNGAVSGNVTAKGAISPGASVGALTFNNDLTLGGNVLIDVDKALSPGASNDLITVTGTLSHGGGGSVTVVNLGPALVIGDSFKIFSQAVASGQSIAVSGGGATWTNKLWLDGSIAVTAISPIVPATNLTIQAVGPTSRSLGGQGASNGNYNVYAATNVTTPMANWWLIGTTNSTAGGVIQFLDSQATNTQRFYRFGQ